MATEHPQLLLGCHVPQVQVACTKRRASLSPDQILAVGRKGKRLADEPDCRIRLPSVFLLASVNPPEPKGSTDVVRDKVAAVGRESEVLHGGGMAFQCVLFSSGGRVPEVNLVV